MEKVVGPTVKNKVVLYNSQRRNDILYTAKERKAVWTGYILVRNCLLKHITEGKIKEMIYVTGRRGNIPKQVLDDLKYWTRDCTLKKKH